MLMFQFFWTNWNIIFLLFFDVSNDSFNTSRVFVEGAKDGSNLQQSQTNAMEGVKPQIIGPKTNLPSGVINHDFSPIKPPWLVPAFPVSHVILSRKPRNFRDPNSFDKLLAEILIPFGRSQMAVENGLFVDDFSYQKWWPDSIATLDYQRVCQWVSDHGWYLVMGFTAFWFPEVCEEHDMGGASRNISEDVSFQGHFLITWVEYSIFGCVTFQVSGLKS